MAKGLGVAHETRQLTADPAHNATLGAAYLRRMVDEFGPSVAMVAAGYNAGPGRPRKWVAEFGDPRTGDPVDWVETIPFTETRTYVMRVTESLVIYRQRLKGQAGPIKITAKFSQGDDIYRERRSLFWKKMQIVRGCDAKRNVLVYMVYSDRLIEGSPKNSTSSVPIMPWYGVLKSTSMRGPLLYFPGYQNRPRVL